MTYPATTKFAVILTSAALCALPALAKDKDATGGAVIDIANVEVCAALPNGVNEQICKCPSDFSASSVWGSGPYTGDSNVCSAALHSGLLSFSDTLIQVVRRDGQTSYSGSSNNGVTTNDWGTYGESFDVYSVAAPIATSTDQPRLPTCQQIPADAVNFNCACPADGANSGVWGSDPYTADSDICTAARHAGYIDSAGGDLVVLRLQGLETYVGTELNGITSSNWGSYGSSITFDWN